VQHFERRFVYKANYQTIMSVHHLVCNIQDGGQKPEVQITFTVTDTDVFNSRNGVNSQAVCTYPRATVAIPFSSEYQDVSQEPEVVLT